MDLSGLGGFLLVAGLIALVIGYVVPVAVLVTLGWIGVGVGLVLVVLGFFVGGRRGRRVL